MIQLERMLQNQKNTKEHTESPTLFIFSNIACKVTHRRIQNNSSMKYGKVKTINDGNEGG